jgi:anti-sigma regulatory factor (Ser/Thr protein kinase)
MDPTALAPHPPQIYRLRVPNSPAGPKICRDIVALLLRATGHGALTDTARLLVSEVVTNVGLHTTSLAVRLEAVIRHDCVRVSVYDDEHDAIPAPNAPNAQAEGGRGLLLLSGFAHAWGVTRATEFPDHGKRVWFELRDVREDTNG